MDEKEKRGERLHKVLARSGVASRRECEALITQGRVKVDGQTVQRLGMVVDPSTQTITFDGETIRPERPAYYLVYKPKGVVCTTHDQFDRKSVIDLVQDKARRLFPVGRMEEDSEGLILVTNDGRFADRVISYRNPLRHLYFVRLQGQLTQEGLDKVRGGVWLSDGRTGPMWVKVQRWGKKASTVMCSPSATQHRLLRRAWAKVGVQPDKVVRVRIGPLTTDGLKKGTFRRLTNEEVAALLHPAPEDLMPWVERRPAGARSRSRRQPGGEGQKGQDGQGRSGSAPGGRRGPAGPGRRSSKKDSSGARQRRIVGP
jgi:23S rRNA pseudouridine2605 synthase